jgi:hypothetical protein
MRLCCLGVDGIWDIGEYRLLMSCTMSQSQQPICTLATFSLLFRTLISHMLLDLCSIELAIVNVRDLTVIADIALPVFPTKRKQPACDL